MSESELTQIEVSQPMQEAPTLYAGKFKSIEDLEHGYKQSLPLYQKNKELESQLKQYSHVPDDYKVPDNIKMRDTQINELKKLAKSAGLNEEQFSKAAASVNARTQDQIKAFEERQKKVGEEKINLTRSFIDSRFDGFSDEFKNTMVNKIIMDDNTMNDALRQRENSLNTSIPGSNRTSAPIQSNQYQDAQKEVADLAIAAEHRPNDMQLRQKLINKAEEVGHYRKELANR